MLATRSPSATYRIQLNKNFRLRDAITIIDYLHALGISDLYLSPVLTSRKGSDHGYDITDPTRINPDLGSEEDFAALQTELQERGMGLLLDIVPNHMAASAENPWWMDVLENGAQSPYAVFFDIDWHPHARSLEGRILLPVLGRPFGEVLDAGDIKLTLQEGKFFFQYFDSLFPLAPKSYHAILDNGRDRFKQALGEEAPAYREYSGILASLLDLVRGDQGIAESAADRRLRYESTRDRLWALAKNNAHFSAVLDDVMREINGSEGSPASFGFLQRLLAEQNYKLSYWQNLNESINYRRFFTIADLVGVRVEDPVVFEATHGYILRLVSKNLSAGLRIDHIDGLRDPSGYLNKLQEHLSASSENRSPQGYVVVEKILSHDESLPGDWPVSGTTGYDFLNKVNGVFIDPQGIRSIEESYSGFIGRKENYADIAYQKKKLVMSRLLGVEMRTLGRHLAELAVQDRYARELPRGQLIDALIEVTACLDVYRTYIHNLEVPAQAAAYIEKAVDLGRTRASHLSSACFDFVREVLLLLNLPHVLPDQREARLAFVMRWQQFTGPIVAKGLEDTALYVYYPLLSMNEVGGEPSPVELDSREEFYSFLKSRLENRPDTLDATSTHDTKRSEDVRARLNVLSEMPEEWKQRLDCWSRQNARHKAQVDGQPVPDRNEEYFLYQTLLGVWPLDRDTCSTLIERVQAHLVKATREAMVHTRWTRPNQVHEEALQKFVANILSSKSGGEFLRDFREFQQKVAYCGMINGLSQTLLKITAPGVPDFYQGSELWDLRLVDPDNRGPIDFQERISALDSLGDQESAGSPQHLVEQWHDGGIKLYMIWKALHFRREHEQLFREGEFVPVESAGKYARNVIAFLRRQAGTTVLVAIPRWLSNLQSETRSPALFDWEDTRLIFPSLGSARWHSVLAPQSQDRETADNISLSTSNLFRDFPVALFQS